MTNRTPDATDNAELQARAQVESIVAMVAALECDYDRLEELRHKRAAGHWVAGWNMPGYMPDSEPSAFDSCDEARTYIADEMQRHIDESGEFDTIGNIPANPLGIESCRNGDGEYGATFGNWHYWVSHQPNALADADESAELAELEEAAGECESEEDARERIQEDALSVEFRSGWASSIDEFQPEEFRIVLCTGGPHVEILGELDDHNQPDRVRIIFKDWGTSGELFDFDSDAVLTYCRQFYFGE